MGTTMATYCSQNLGAKEYGRIRKGIRCACLISGCLCVFSFAVVWLAGRYIALLFIDAGRNGTDGTDPAFPAGDHPSIRS